MSILFCIFVLSKETIITNPQVPEGHQDMTTANEFKSALEMVNSCLATINCGCSITPDEGLYADSLYYRCREYMQAYDESKYWESRYRNKQ